MKMPNTANFWLLYGDNFHIAEDCMPQSFDSGSLQVLIECLVNPQVNSGDIAGNPDIFDFMDERSMDIYNELYPNLFN